jgi:transposase
VLEGDARWQAAEQTGMDRQTLRDWVHRYNDEGIDGLKSRGSPGRAEEAAFKKTSALC